MRKLSTLFCYVHFMLCGLCCLHNLENFDLSELFDKCKSLNTSNCRTNITSETNLREILGTRILYAQTEQLSNGLFPKNNLTGRWI